MVEILEEEKCETNTILATTQREWLEWVEKRTHLNHSKPFNRKCLPFLCGLKIRTRNLWIHMCWAFPAHAKLEEPSHSSLICFLNHLQYTFFKRQEYGSLFSCKITHSARTNESTSHIQKHNKTVNRTSKTLKSWNPILILNIAYFNLQLTDK